MTIETIYIARHGYRSNWLPPPHPAPPTGIDSDPALAPHGVDQARELAKYLGGLPEEEKPQFIISSPFYRCVETSAPIAEELKVPLVIERGVGEWFKKDRGIVPEPANYDLLKQFFKQLADEETWDRDSSTGVIPSLEGENEDDIFERAALLWKKFIPAFEAKFPNINKILIVTHAATKIALGMQLLGRSSVYDTINNEGEILKAAACSLDKYVKSNDNWEIMMNGNCSFLTEGEEMDWNFHSKFEAGSDEDIKAREEAKKNSKAGKWSPQEVTTVENSTSGTEEINDDDFENFYVTVDVPMIGNPNFSQLDTGKTTNAQSTNTGEEINATTTRPNYIKSSSKFQITEIEDPHPLIKISNSSIDGDNEDLKNMCVIDGNIYQTDWQKLVGSDLIFDDEGNLVSVVREHLKVNENVKFVPTAENVKEQNISDEENDSKIKEELTSFLKAAIRAAKEVNKS